MQECRKHAGTAHPELLELGEMRHVLDLLDKVVTYIEGRQVHLQRRAISVSSAMLDGKAQLTLFSNPSILVNPLWLRYSSSRLTRQSSPSSLVIRLDWMERILRFTKDSRPCTGGTSVCGPGLTAVQRFTHLQFPNLVLSQPELLHQRTCIQVLDLLQSQECQHHFKVLACA